jgi:large subunit ribosomal protein L13
MKATRPTKIKEIKRAWHLIDVDGKILGRSASDIALLLMGKAKTHFVRNLDCGDFVVVINAKNIKITGKKETLKNYYRHSGYPGGFKSETYTELENRKPGEVIRHAVAGMLPQNKLKALMLKRLYIFQDGEHTYKDKFTK